MPDYKQMYTSLFRAVTKAVNILEEAQRTTEDIYVEAEDRTAMLSLLNERPV